MITERAYFSVCQYQLAFIFIFGGLKNYETVDTIERYDIS